jgi:hypothetical protein
MNPDVTLAATVAVFVLAVRPLLRTITRWAAR